MAQPASVPYPSSDNTLLIVRELKSHLETLAKHLQDALENRQLSQQHHFLQEFSDNRAALNKLLSSIPFKEIRPDLKPVLEELVKALTNIFSSSIQDEDSTIFFTSLVQYSESFRILIQELKLIAQELNTYL